METIYDCAIVGGGPAGLNAALVLGRARRTVVLIDDDRPRNRVTRESHGFITRDGVNPAEFRAIARDELARYPSVQVESAAATGVFKEGAMFRVQTAEGGDYLARKIILATGLREKLPEVPGIGVYYGTSVFSCPYCDGWERKDEPLIVISETEHAFDLVKSVSQWSRDLVLCTNGYNVISEEQARKLEVRDIPVHRQKIAKLEGEEGRLRKVVFEDGSATSRTGGFVSPIWRHPVSFGESLGCRFTDHGGIEADDYGRTSVDGVFAAGDAALIVPAQLIVAAAGGSRAAIGVNVELTGEEF